MGDGPVLLSAPIGRELNFGFKSADGDGGSKPGRGLSGASMSVSSDRVLPLKSFNPDKSTDGADPRLAP